MSASEKSKMTPEAQAQRAKALWDKIWPRINHMTDLRDGNHARRCIMDIAEALQAERQAALEEIVPEARWAMAKVERLSKRADDYRRARFFLEKYEQHAAKGGTP